MITLDNNIFEKFKTLKTKNIIELLKEIKILKSKKILFVLPKPNQSIWLATRNLKNMEITTANCLNLTQILEAENIILFNNSFEIINQTYGKKQNKSFQSI